MLVAGLLKGCIGFGAPLVAVPLLALFVGPRPAVILMSVPLLLTNGLIIAGQPFPRAELSRFLPILVPLVPTTFLGGALLASANPAWLAVTVGVVAITFSVVSWVGVSLRPPAAAERVVGAVLGSFAGLLNGSTSIPGPLFAMYLSTQGLDKRAFVYGISLLLVVGNASQVLSYVQLDLYSGGWFLAAASLAPALLAGQQVGLRIQTRIQSALFMHLVLVAVAASGVNLLVRSLGAL
jgi:uncharacterized protein